MPAIINSDDGVVSGSSGLKTSGGNDGITTFQQNGTESGRITAAGNFGFGTTSPSTKVHVVGVVTATQGVGGTPTFSATAGSATSLSAATFTKVNFSTEGWDTANCYDTSNSRFTPNVAGYYQINCMIRADITSNSVLHLYIRKNGVDEIIGDFISVTNNQAASVASGLIYCNGTTDYVEAGVFSGVAGNTSTGIACKFQGILVRAA